MTPKRDFNFFFCQRLTKYSIEREKAFCVDSQKYAKWKKSQSLPYPEEVGSSNIFIPERMKWQSLLSL
jgi:hypothetical protein